jgi:hypothetical protein
VVFLAALMAEEVALKSAKEAYGGLWSSNKVKRRGWGKAESRKRKAEIGVLRIVVFWAALRGSGREKIVAYI